MKNKICYTIDSEKLDEVTRLYNDADPNATEEDVKIFVCADWPEGDEHQAWIDESDPQEIADWMIAAVFS